MIRRKASLINLPVVLSLLVTLGCGGDGKEGEDSAKPRVVCTTGMIGWMAEQIAGSEAAVISLMGPGVDPHLFKASEGDVRRLGEADLILYNGLH